MAAAVRSLRADAELAAFLGPAVATQRSSASFSDIGLEPAVARAGRPFHRRIGLTATAERAAASDVGSGVSSGGGATPPRRDPSRSRGKAPVRYDHSASHPR